MKYWSDAPRELPKPMQPLFQTVPRGLSIISANQFNTMLVYYQTYYVTMGSITYPCWWHLKDPGIHVYECMGLSELMKYTQDSQVAYLK